MSHFLTIVAIVSSYVVGSVPTGLWLGKRLRGIDIREHGSKNIGATNTMRVLGKTLGAVALAADMAKGALAVGIGYSALRFGADFHTPLYSGLAAILGHSFSIFLWFRGGKGVATSTGVFLALAWQPTLIAAAVFGAVVAATRMVSAGSIAAAVTLSVTMFLFMYRQDQYVCYVTLVVALLVILKHRSNIKRILRGTENRLDQKASTNPRA